VSISTPEFTPVFELPAAPPVPELAPFVGNGRPPRLPRRRLGKHATATFALVLLVTIGAGALRFAEGIEPVHPIAVEPTVVYATIMFDPVIVRGAPPEVRASAGKKSGDREIERVAPRRRKPDGNRVGRGFAPCGVRCASGVQQVEPRLHGFYGFHGSLRVAHRPPLTGRAPRQALRPRCTELPDAEEQSV